MSTLRILCVDSNPGDVDAFRRATEDAGLATHVQAAGSETDLREALTEPWDAVLFEWAEPAVPPVRCMALVQDALPGVPTAVFSREDSARSARAARSFGYIDYFVKDEKSACIAWLRDRDEQDTALGAVDSENGYRALFELAHDAILLITGADGRIANANRAAIQLLGYTLQEFRAMSAFDLVPKDHLDEAQASFRRQMVADAPFLVETFWRPKEGGIVPVSVSGAWVTRRGVPSIFLVARNMTVHRTAAEALRRSDRRLRDAQRAAHVGSWESDLRGNSFWSDEMYRIFEWNLGKSPPALNEFMPLVHPEDTALITRAMHGAMERGEPFDIDYRIVTPEGREKYVNAVGEPRKAQDGTTRYVGTVTDITSRKLSELHARNLHARLTQHMANSPLAYIEWDNEWRLVEWNQRAVEMFGWEQHEVLGQRWGEWRFVHEDDLNHVSNATNGLLTGENHNNVVMNRNYRGDGSVLHCEWYNSALTDEDGHVISILSLVHDITDRVVAEEERRLNRERLMQADKLASLGTLVAGVAHEINNPNQFILSNAQSMEKIWQWVAPALLEAYGDSANVVLGGMTWTELSESMTEANRHIVEGSRRIQRIVQELSDYARQNPHDPDELVDVNDAVRAAVTLMSNQIAKYTTAFSAEYDEKAPRVTGNFQRIEQVVVNLIQNACQSLTDSERAVRVAVEGLPREGAIRVTIEDEGAGIDAESLQRIFDPFFTTKRESGGTGLGLSLSDSIVREHGGTLVFDSKPDIGTRVTMWLPAAVDARTTGARGAPRPKPKGETR